MKLLFEMFPIILFFTVYKFKDIYTATAVAIAASILQIAYAYFKNKKVEAPMVIGLVVIIIFGGATLIVRDEMFIKWKPTVLYWIFSSVMIIGRFILKKNFIYELLHKQMEAPTDVWEKMNFMWILFFAAIGGLNLYIVYNYSTHIWVNFKLFGILGCMILFIVIQAMMIAPYIKNDPDIKNDSEKNEM
ncbi:MAG: septation protein A [Leptospirales bacterium]|nr:septation protein A [Leptospirales bacterium]